MKRFFIPFASILLTGLLLSGCAQNETAASGEEAGATERKEASDGTEMGAVAAQKNKVFHFGETIPMGVMSFTVNGAKTNARFKQGASNTLAGEPVPQGQGDAMLVSVTIANLGNTAFRVTPSMFKLEGEKGGLHEPSSNGPGLFNMKDFPTFTGLDSQPQADPVVITLVFEAPDNQNYDLLIDTGNGPIQRVSMVQEW